MPPCGTCNCAPTAIEMAPATAEPTMIAGITRKGSLAAKGIAPSVMKEIPSAAAALPASRSSLEKRLRKSIVASAMPSGGVIPAAMMAAIGS